MQVLYKYIHMQALYKSNFLHGKIVVYKDSVIKKLLTNFIESMQRI